MPLLDTVSFLGFVFQILEDRILEHFLALDSGFASCFYFLSCRPDEVRVELLDILARLGLVAEAESPLTASTSASPHCFLSPWYVLHTDSVVIRTLRTSNTPIAYAQHLRNIICFAGIAVRN